MENKLKCAETLISALLPGIDVYSPTFNLQGFLESIQKARTSTDSSLRSSLVSITKLGLGNSSSTGVNNEIDEETGLPRGSAFFSNKYQKLTRDGSGNSTLSAMAEEAESNVLNTLYSPQSSGSPENLAGREIKIILPPKHVASELIEAVWDNACVLFRFYHRPSFIRDLDLLYETDPDDYTSKQYKILPLVYSVLAVGVLFSMDKSDRLGFKDASEGYKYFVAARKLIDIADARDTYAIQSIVMMIIFLQCSARLSTCYSYIGVALRSSLRAGLHRKVAYNFHPIELETRKRLFWTIRKMDIYVNAMLGLPRSIAEEDFDQELPEEIDDENITEDGYFPQKEGKISSAGIANAHTRLITILSHVMKQIYPVKQEATEQDGATEAPLYNVAHTKVTEMEDEIREWLESLPMELRPGITPPPEYLKANRLLHLALCHIQVVLYRPFIHYCSPKFSGDEKARASALSCIRVSRTAMHIAHDLVSMKLLNGAYWFSIYTIFFSVACLVYYVHENPRDPEAAAIRRDAELGKDALTSLKDSSMAAQRTYNLLNTLFEQLNRRTAKIPVSNSESPVTVSGGSPISSRLQQFGAGSPSANSNKSQASTPIDNQSEFGAAASGAINIDSNPGLVNSQSYNKALQNPASQAQYSNPSTPMRGKRGRPATTGKRGGKRTGSNREDGVQNTSSSQSSVASTPVSTAMYPSQSGSPVVTAQSNTNVPVANTQSLASNGNSNDAMFADLPGFSFDNAIRSNIPAVPVNNNNGTQGSKNDILEEAIESPHLYVPGIMDQVDSQLFGRFLPPYMLQQSQSMPLGGSSGPHISESRNPMAPSNGARNAVVDSTLKGKANNSRNSFPDVSIDMLMGGSSSVIPPSNQQEILRPYNGNSGPLPPKPVDNGNFRPNNNSNGNSNNNGNTNGAGPETAEDFQNIGTMDDRRLSLSSLFSKGWEDLLAQHNELSGLNSFMSQQ